MSQFQYICIDYWMFQIFGFNRYTDEISDYPLLHFCPHLHNFLNPQDSFDDYSSPSLSTSSSSRSSKATSSSDFSDIPRVHQHIKCRRSRPQLRLSQCTTEASTSDFLSYGTLFSHHCTIGSKSQH